MINIACACTSTDWLEIQTQPLSSAVESSQYFSLWNTNKFLMSCVCQSLTVLPTIYVYEGDLL